MWCEMRAKISITPTSWVHFPIPFSSVMRPRARVLRVVCQVKFHERFKSHTKYYLAFELAVGGELFECLSQRGRSSALVRLTVLSNGDSNERLVGFVLSPVSSCLADVLARLWHRPPGPQVCCPSSLPSPSRSSAGSFNLTRDL